MAAVQTVTTARLPASYDVLGDPTLFESTLREQEESRRPPPPPKVTLEDLPQEIRSVALQSSDNGKVIMEAYEVLSEKR